MSARPLTECEGYASSGENVLGMNVFYFFCLNINVNELRLPDGKYMAIFVRGDLD